jgi:hypothetical protein
MDTPAPTATATPVPIPTEAPTPTEVYIPRQVELVFAPDDVTVPDSCKVVPEATADNTLTLNGQPLPDGTVIKTTDQRTGGSSGNYIQDELLIAARPVAIIELDPVHRDNTWIDQYLLCLSVSFPNGDSMVIESTFINTQQSGFRNTLIYVLSGTDIEGVDINATHPNATPYKVINNADFIELFKQLVEKNQQILLPFEYNFPSNNLAVGENPARIAIVETLMVGKLPQAVHFNPTYYNTVGADLVVPSSALH